jgi:sporulation protein YlmC with PRC-barrel domain
MSTIFSSSTANSRPGGPGPRLMTASTLEGDKIVNLKHELLGTVRDITIDVTTGQIAYVVMAHGGMFGVADKVVPIPWHVLTLDPVRKCLLLDADLTTLVNAPEVGEGQWPQLAADPQWVNELHRYFGSPEGGPEARPVPGK